MSGYTEVKQQPDAKEGLKLLQAHMRADPKRPSQALVRLTEGCGVRWGGDYECRSPACPDCLRRHISREQRVAQSWFGQHDNSDLAMVSVVLEASSDVTGIGDAIVRSRDANRNRFKACRRKSARWDGVYLAGWHEVDAVAADQISLLPPERRELIEQLVPWSLSSGGPAWVTTYHGIVHLNGLAPQDIELAFRRQWPLERQVHVQGFKPYRPVLVNINRIVSYVHKFACTVKLNDGYVEPWPISWQSDYFGWLQGAQRNAFETLRFTVGPKQAAKAHGHAVAGDNNHDDVDVREHERHPMPCSFTGVYHPHYNTGGWR